MLDPSKERLPNGAGKLATVTGQVYDVLGEEVEIMSLYEMAHSLSFQCRYIGHIPVFRSVASHSIQVAEIVESLGGTVDEQLTGLLHDLPEAYIGDMPHPLKACPEFSAAFLAVDHKIASKVIPIFGGIYPLPEIVVEADKQSYLWELENVRTGYWNEDAPGKFINPFLQKWGQLRNLQDS